MKSILIVTISVITLVNSFGQISEQQIDSVFSEWNAKSTPGGVAGVVKDGQLIFAKGYGVADLEHNVLIKPSTVFYLGSTGKQFTSFSILLLEEQGKLSLDDEIQKYLPDFPRYNAPITIRHLIHHTSGIRDYSSLWDLQGRSYMNRISAEETYRMLKRQSTLNFTPGEEYLYSNSGYFLLSEIVEKASGQSLKDFAREHIFEPLGMTKTLFLDDVRDLIKNRAFGYYERDDQTGFNNAIRRFELVGSGGVYSNVLDLYKWGQNFYDNKLGKGSQAIIKKMYTEGVMNNGGSTGYAFGLEVATYKGITMVDHGGSHGGFKAQMRRFPDQNFSVIVLANRSDADVDAKSLQIVDLFLKNEFRTEQKEQSYTSKYIKEDSEALKKFTGHYLFKNSGNIRRIILQNDTLIYYRSESSQDKLVPVAVNKFRLIDSPWPIIVQFQENEAGKRTMSFVVDGRISGSSVRFEPQTYDKEELERFSGTYYSPDLDTSYELKMQGDELVLFVDHKKISPLSTITENVLRNDSFGVFYFETVENGKVKSFKLSSSRVRNVQFIKQ